MNHTCEIYARVNFKTDVVHNELFWEFLCWRQIFILWAFVLDVTELFLR